MALEIGAVGATLWRAVERLERDGRACLVLDLVDDAPDQETAAAIVHRMATHDGLRRLLTAGKVDFATAERIVERAGVDAVPAILTAAASVADARSREHVYDLVAALGTDAPPLVAKRLAELDCRAPGAVMQRDLIALLGRLVPGGALPDGVDLRGFLKSPAAPVRREAIKLMLRAGGGGARRSAGRGDRRRRRAHRVPRADGGVRAMPAPCRRAHPRAPRPGRAGSVAPRARHSRGRDGAHGGYAGLAHIARVEVVAAVRTDVAAPRGARDGGGGDGDRRRVAEGSGGGARGGAGDEEPRCAIPRRGARAGERRGGRPMSDPVRFLTSFVQSLSTMALYAEKHPARERAVDRSFEVLRELQLVDSRPQFTFLGDGDDLRAAVAARDARLGVGGAARQRRACSGSSSSRSVTRDEYEEFLEEVLARLALTAIDTSEMRTTRRTTIKFGPIGVRG